MYFISNLSLIVLGKKLNNLYGFVTIYHCMQLDDFLQKTFPSQNNSIFMI